MSLELQATKVSSVVLPSLETDSTHIDMLRDDLIHPIVSGNKWRKLKYLIQDAEGRDCKTLISMGGNYSNHLHALAFAGKEFGFKTIGFVRAHQDQELTPTLKDCVEWGMELVFVSRTGYAQLRNKSQWNELGQEYPNSYWITEGGFSELAIQGVQEIAGEVTSHYDFIFCGVGSGATLIGLAKTFPQSKVVGVAAFKGADYLLAELEEQLKGLDNWVLEVNHHHGGFAKTSRDLEQLGAQFTKLNGFTLDKVYNLKVLSALMGNIDKGLVLDKHKVLLINTGGIQGNRKQ